MYDVLDVVNLRPIRGSTLPDGLMPAPPALERGTVESMLPRLRPSLTDGLEVSAEEQHLLDDCYEAVHRARVKHLTDAERVHVPSSSYPALIAVLLREVRQEAHELWFTPGVPSKTLSACNSLVRLAKLAQEASTDAQSPLVQHAVRRIVKLIAALSTPGVEATTDEVTLKVGCLIQELRIASLACRQRDEHELADLFSSLARALDRSCRRRAVAEISTGNGRPVVPRCLAPPGRVSVTLPHLAHAPPCVRVDAAR